MKKKTEAERAAAKSAKPAPLVTMRMTSCMKRLALPKETGEVFLNLASVSREHGVNLRAAVDYAKYGFGWGPGTPVESEDAWIVEQFKALEVEGLVRLGTKPKIAAASDPRIKGLKLIEVLRPAEGEETTTLYVRYHAPWLWLLPVEQWATKHFVSALAMKLA